MFGMSAKDRLALFEKKSTSDTKKGSAGPKKIGKLNVGGSKEQKSEKSEGKPKKAVKKKEDKSAKEAANGAAVVVSDNVSQVEEKKAEETKQSQPEATPVSPKEEVKESSDTSASKNKTDVTTDKKKSGTDKSDTTVEKKKVSTDKKDTTTDKKKSGSDKNDTTTEKKKISTDKKDTTTDKKKSGTEKSDTTTERKESDTDKEDTTIDKKKSSSDKSDTPVDKKKIEAGKRDITKDKKGIDADKNDKVTDKKKTATDKTNENKTSTDQTNSSDKADLKEKDSDKQKQKSFKTAKKDTGVDKSKDIGKTEVKKESQEKSKAETEEAVISKKSEKDSESSLKDKDKSSKEKEAKETQKPSTNKAESKTESKEKADNTSKTSDKGGKVGKKSSEETITSKQKTDQAKPLSKKGVDSESSEKTSDLTTREEKAKDKVIETSPEAKTSTVTTSSKDQTTTPDDTQKTPKVTDEQSTNEIKEPGSGKQIEVELPTEPKASDPKAQVIEDESQAKPDQEKEIKEQVLQEEETAKQDIVNEKETENNTATVPAESVEADSKLVTGKEPIAIEEQSDTGSQQETCVTEIKEPEKEHIEIASAQPEGQEIVQDQIKETAECPLPSEDHRIEIPEEVREAQGPSVGETEQRKEIQDQTEPESVTDNQDKVEEVCTVPCESKPEGELGTETSEKTGTEVEIQKHSETETITDEVVDGISSEPLADNSETDAVKDNQAVSKGADTSTVEEAVNEVTEESHKTAEVSPSKVEEEGKPDKMSAAAVVVEDMADQPNVLQVEHHIPENITFGVDPNSGGESKTETSEIIPDEAPEVMSEKGTEDYMDAQMEGNYECGQEAEPDEAVLVPAEPIIEQETLAAEEMKLSEVDDTLSVATETGTVMSSAVSDILDPDDVSRMKDDELDLSAELEANLKAKTPDIEEKLPHKEDQVEPSTTPVLDESQDKQPDIEETVKDYNKDDQNDHAITLSEDVKEIPESNVKAVPVFKPIPEEFYDTLFYFSGMGTVVGSALAKGVYVPHRATKTALDVECIESYESTKDDEIMKETKNIRTARHQANDLSDELRNLKFLLGGLPTFQDTSSHIHKIDTRARDTTMHARYHAFQPVGKPTKANVAPLKLGNSDGSAFKSRQGGVSQPTVSTQSGPTTQSVAPPTTCSKVDKPNNATTVQAPHVPPPPPPAPPAPKPVTSSAPAAQPKPEPAVSSQSANPPQPPQPPPCPKPMVAPVPVPPPPPSLKALSETVQAAAQATASVQKATLPCTEFKPIPATERPTDKENAPKLNLADAKPLHFTNGPVNDQYKSKPLAPIENQPKHGGIRHFGEYAPDPKMAGTSKPWQERYGTKTVEDTSPPKPYESAGSIPSGLKPWELSRMRGLEARGYQFSHEAPKSGADHSDSFYHGTTAIENGEEEVSGSKGYTPFLVSRRSKSSDRDKQTAMAQKAYQAAPHGYSGQGDPLPYSDV